jgi:hypothetical protein
VAVGTIGGVIVAGALMRLMRLDKDNYLATPS